MAQKGKGKPGLWAAVALFAGIAVWSFVRTVKDAQKVSVDLHGALSTPVIVLLLFGALFLLIYAVSRRTRK